MKKLLLFCMFLCSISLSSWAQDCALTNVGPYCYSTTSNIEVIAFNLCPDVASDFISVNIDSGQVEDTWDEFEVLSIDPGVDTTIVYSDYGFFGDLTGLSVQADGAGECLTIRVNSDGTNTCASSGFTPIYYTMSCGAQNPIPACAGLIAPPDGSSGITVVPFTQFTVPSNATDFEFFLGTTSGALTSIGTLAQEDSILTIFLTNLNPDTTYFWQIVPQNSTGPAVGCREWSFTCQSPPQSASGASCSSGTLASFFFEDFSGVSAPGWTGEIGNGTNEMWDIIQTGGTGSPNTGPSGAHSGGNYAYFEASVNGAVADMATLISPAIDLSGTTDAVELEFFMHMFGPDMGSLTVMATSDTTGGGIWTQLDSLSEAYHGSEAASWLPARYDLSAFAGGDVYLRFDALKFDPDDFSADMAIDAISVRTCQSCPSPSNGSVSAINSTGGTLMWTENGTAGTWDIEIDTAGFVPSGTPTFQTMSLPHPWAGGIESTDYEFYVRSDCGGSSSTWAGPYAFSTTCAVQTPAPEYCQGFELFPDGNLDGVLFDCWQNVRSAEPEWKGEATTTVSTGTGPSGPNAGSRYVYLETSSGTAGTTDTITGPLVDVSSLSAPQLSFYYHMFGSSMGSLHYQSSIDGGAWSNLGTIVGQQQTATTDPWIERTAGLSGSTVRIRFVGETGGTFTSDMAIDDVCIRETPSCPAPSALSASNISTTSAEIKWSAGGSETDWVVSYDTAGVAAGAGTQVATTVDSLDLASLTPDTQYDVYVRAVCNPDSSAWVGPLTFMTLGIPPSNDDCETAIALTVNGDLNCGSFMSGTLQFATASAEAEGCSGTFDDDVWYSFVATDTTHVIQAINLAGSTTDIVFQLSTGSCGALTELQCHDTPNSGFTATSLDVDSTYYIRVASWTPTGGQTTTFDICVGTLPPPPANDECLMAETLLESDLTCNNMISGTTVSASPSVIADSSCSETNSDVWYTFTPGSTADYNISVTETMDFGSSSTYVSVFSGVCGALTQINSSCFSTSTTVALTASTTYLINVRSTSSTAGVNFDLCAYTCGTVIPNYLESFDAFNGNCWDEADAGSISTGPMTLGTGSWLGDDFGNVVGGPNGRSARINAFVTHADWLLSPTFDLSAGGHTLTFDVAATEYASNSLAAIWPSTDTMFLLISEDGGSSWTSLMQWDALGFPSLAGDSITVDLTSNTSATTQFAFYYTTGGVDSPEDIDVFADEFEITTAASPCSPLTINGTPASDTYQGTTITSDATIQNPNVVIFKAETSIDLEENFEVEAGAEFDALIEDCP